MVYIIWTEYRNHKNTKANEPDIMRFMVKTVQESPLTTKETLSKIR